MSSITLYCIFSLQDVAYAEVKLQLVCWVAFLLLLRLMLSPVKEHPVHLLLLYLNQKKLADVLSLGCQWQIVWWIKLYYHRCGQCPCNVRYVKISTKTKSTEIGVELGPHSPLHLTLIASIWCENSLLWSSKWSQREVLSFKISVWGVRETGASKPCYFRSLVKSEYGITYYLSTLCFGLRKLGVPNLWAMAYRFSMGKFFI